MECKDALQAQLANCCCGINRNIVECKAKQSPHIYSVLYRINRNIVECKDHEAGTADRKAYVLIETLWNVKNNEYDEEYFEFGLY